MARKLLVNTLLQGFLVVILALSLTISIWAQDKPRLMVSTYESARNIVIEELVSEMFAVGVVKNTGNISLSLTLYWLQAYGNYTLPITVHPTTKILTADQLCEVSIEVKEDAKLGYYNGTVEVEAVPIQELPGNPTVPGGSFPVGVTVITSSVESPPQDQTEPENQTQPIEPFTTVKTPFSYVPLVVATLIICIGATLLVYFKKVRKPMEK